MAGDLRGDLRIASAAVHDTTVLTLQGTLDSSTYRSLRDGIIRAALDEPDAVIVEVTDLAVPAESAWMVFTSARWHVARWPEVSILLVCGHAAGRSVIVDSGVARYLPVFSSVEEAAGAVDSIAHASSPRFRRRARADLPIRPTSLRRARELVAEWLMAWSQDELIPVAKVVVTTLVENVLQHTDSNPTVRLESNGATVTVAVADTSHVPAGVHEDGTVNAAPSGLRILSALCRTWGNAPTPSGKTVWAVIGPENRL